VAGDAADVAGTDVVELVVELVEDVDGVAIVELVGDDVEALDVELVVVLGALAELDEEVELFAAEDVAAAPCCSCPFWQWYNEGL